MTTGRDNSAEIAVSLSMSRPVIRPAIVVAIVVVGLTGAFTAHRSDARAQRSPDR